MPKQLVEREILERRITRRLSLRGPIGVGHWIPGSVLLIGEQSAKPRLSANQEPFCATTGCSGWLTAQLELNSIPEERLYWLNALNNDGTEVDLVGVYKMLAPSAVIAMGKVAERLCAKHSDVVRYFPIQHPQYWKRFQHFTPYPLFGILSRSIPERKISVEDAGMGWLSLNINGHRARTSPTMSDLVRLKDNAKWYRLPKDLRLRVGEWLRLDLGLTDNEVTGIQYFDERIGQIPFRVI